MDFFSTLPEKEFISGYGEALKYSFIAGKNFYSLLNGRYADIRNNDSKISRIISESVIFKSSVVEKDEKETGLRKILNFGHTFGHAFETAMNYKIKHGEGVILGILCALKLSYDKGYLPENLFNKFLKYVDNTGIRLAYKLPDEELLYSIMLKDKKNKAGKIKFVLLTGLGQTVCDAEADKDEALNSVLFAKRYFF
jgi:3-dehydroquinate synthetase